MASNQYSEIENVAKEIIKLVKNENYRYKEISIITKDLSNYANLIKAIFANYNIPVFIDEKKELSQNIFMKYIISLLDIYAKSWSYDSVINYIKTGFVKIDNDDIYMLENYCKKWGIKGSKWYVGEWSFEEITEENKEKIERIQVLRNQIVTPLIKLREEINKNKTVSSITKKLYEFLIENEIDKILIEKKEKLEEQNYIEISNEQELAWDIMLEVLDELILIFGEEKIGFEKYMSLIMVGLRASGLGRIPQTQDQVIVGDIERSRTHKVKAVFILGMNDGAFPSVNKNEGFLGDKDREFRWRNIKTFNINNKNKKAFT